MLRLASVTASPTCVGGRVLPAVRTTLGWRVGAAVHLVTVTPRGLSCRSVT